MRKTRVSKQFLTALGVLLLLTSLSSSLSAWPRAARVQGIRRQVFDYLDEFPQLEDAVESVLNYRKQEGGKIEQLLAQYEHSLPDTEALPELLSEIQAASEYAGVQDTAISTRSTQRLMEIDATAEGAWHRIPFTLSGKAGYKDIALLLDRLSQARRLIVLRELVLQRTADSLIVFQAHGEAYCRLQLAERRR